MGGLPVTAKYVIHARLEVEGVVEKPDVIGAIFGQTEGLLGPDLDLRELQKTGRIGRINVELKERGGKTIGRITIPSSLDRVETALIAALVETVDKVGPYSARIRVERIEDLRTKKRQWVIERAKEILLKWEREEMPDIRKIVERILREVTELEVIKYGKEELPAGPDVDKSDILIIVEGRADVVNLVRHGYKNVIAIGGATKIPKTIIDLSKRKTTIAFVDGDRGGDLILRELLKVAKIDYVARAPPGKEVEELTAKEIAKCLKNKISAGEYLAQIGVVKEEVPKKVFEYVSELRGTLEALILDDRWNAIGRVLVRDLVDYMDKIDKAHAIIFDGIITQRLVDKAFSKGVRYLIGVRVGSLSRQPEGIRIMTFDELEHKLEEKSV
ncbi:MAG: DNA primase [Thermoprotei archaeon]|mgnify:CR=1 FL=1|nr:MAG: DNA primase [Thermoprotei archaeon]RLF19881.1 MAG: DNA primase [Thermoprotei archaeon]